MPFFPLAGGEIVAFILLFAISRWILRTGWRGAFEDAFRSPEPRPGERPGPESGGASAPPQRPTLRLIRGGRDGEPAPPATARRAGSRRDQ